MDQDHPGWLTLEFLDQCIRSKERYREMRTTSFSSEHAVPFGNNYGSYILRVKVRLQDQGKREHSLSLIIKCPLTSGTMKELFDSNYESEPGFYNEFLELGSRLLNRSFTADHYTSPISTVVVLEDLKEEGFVMADKLEQLDLKHCQLYMTAAANFHSMSFAVHKQDPDIINRIGKEKLFSNDLDQEMIRANTNMIKYCFESFAYHVSEFLESDRIPRIMRRSANIFWDLLVEAMEPNEKFNTLNQGDPWLTNMMFKRDEAGDPYDIKLLDFQCLRYASPISDLMFFIWTSANYDVLKNRQDTLYELYLVNLNDALDEMKIVERLSMKTLTEHVAQLSPVALWAVALCRPVIMESSFTDMDLLYARCKEEYSPEHNPYEVLYTESFCRNHLPQLVNCLDNSGVFDYIESTLEKYNR